MPLGNRRHRWGKRFTGDGRLRVWTCTRCGQRARLFGAPSWYLVWTAIEYEARRQLDHVYGPFGYNTIQEPFAVWTTARPGCFVPARNGAAAPRVEGPLS